MMPKRRRPASTISFSVYDDAALIDRLRAFADLSERSVNSVMQQAVREFLSRATGV